MYVKICLAIFYTDKELYKILYVPLKGKEIYLTVLQVTISFWEELKALILCLSLLPKQIVFRKALAI